jgi:NADPH-dependent curcumin reductase CurA
MNLQGVMSREIVLAARPEPAVTPALFELRESAVEEPGDGQFLVRVIYLSLEPAMRGWIADAPNYQDPVALGAVMTGFTVGEVAASRHPDYAEGDLVAGRQGWQEWALSDGSDIERKLAPGGAPLSCHLHVLGINGITAYFGLREVGRPKAGETVVVSTAAGSVGSIVGQIAKIEGCRTVGLTGSDEKAAQCRELFGYDHALNYKTETNLAAAVAAACPQGVDVYFDNVGGPVSDAVMPALALGARVIVCGTMGMGASPEGPRYNRHILVNRATMQGFLVFDHWHRRDEAVQQLERWLADGRIAYLEDITDGLDKAPEALCRMLAGGNRGKTLIRVGPEPGKSA